MDSLLLFLTENHPPLKRFGLKRKLRLGLAVRNRFADFQAAALRLRFSFASVAPSQKNTATAFSLKIARQFPIRPALFFSAVAIFTPTQPPSTKIKTKNGYSAKIKL